ncbi:hypothetical protein HMPREF1651_06530 [Prevotella bivia DNF00188]|nr:hypothetical protein HMPREF1651_06530 [Prevotella bivia DNF00188]
MTVIFYKKHLRLQYIKFFWGHNDLSKLRKGIVGLAGNAFYFLSVSLSIIVKAVAARKEYLFMQELTYFQRQPYP